MKMKDVQQLVDPLALAAINLLRALRVVALTNETRMEKVRARDEEVMWFLEYIDDLAPALHRCGWIEYAEPAERPGEIVVTTRSGCVRAIVITDVGRKQCGRIRG